MKLTNEILEHLISLTNSFNWIDDCGQEQHVYVAELAQELIDIRIRIHEIAWEDDWNHQRLWYVIMGKDLQNAN